jgi:UDPglucose 6-dehydrogenase
VRVSVIGAGYVGIITAIGLASVGHHVCIMDQSKERIFALSEGELPFYEKDAKESLLNCLAARKLELTSEIEDAILFSELIFVCVGTPAREDGSADLSAVESVAKSVAEVATSYKCLVEKSTVPAGTSKWIRRTLRLYGRPDVSVDVASNPEFLREGSALGDFLEPDRIVIGAESHQARELLLEAYRSFEAEKIICNIETAELIKHASNSFLATKISFINMISDLSEKVGADIRVVAKGMGLDPRIGERFLHAGLGYGGSCFPKDTKALMHMASSHGLDFELLRAVDEINCSRIDKVLSLARNALWSLGGKTVSLWGSSFKSDTDDVRESQALKLVERLVAEGAEVVIHDPKAMETTRSALSDMARLKSRFAADIYSASMDASCVIVATDWKEFTDVDPSRLRRLMKTPIVIDARNLLCDLPWEKSGFEYCGVGIGEAVR